MMNGLSPFLASGASVALKSGTSSPTHLPFLSGSAPGTLGSHQMSFFRSLHGLPCEVGGGAVVEDAPVGRPREAPAVAQGVLLVGGLAPVGLVEELAVGPLDDHPRVDPAPARRLAVVGHVAEGVERLALLVDDLAVLVRDLLGGEAVDLAQDELHVRLLWGCRRT